MTEYVILTYDLKGRAWKERKRISRENFVRGLIPIQSSTYILRKTQANEKELAEMEKFLVGLGAKTMLMKGEIVSIDGNGEIAGSMSEMVDKRYHELLAETREFTQKLTREKTSYRAAVGFLEKKKAVETALAKSDMREVISGPRLLFEAELVNLERTIINLYSKEVEKQKQKARLEVI